LKTEKMIELTEKLKKTVSFYRPQALYSRIVYAPILTDVTSEEWFAQNYDRCLDSYDYVTIMAYPRMEGEFFASSWLKRVVSIAKTKKNGLRKTVFKVQTFDWKKNEWIKSATVVDWLRTLMAQGAHHTAYYPDNLYDDKPNKEKIRDVISSKTFPFKEVGKK